MRKANPSRRVLAIAAVMLATPAPLQAETSAAASIHKTLKTLVGAIRFGKWELAAAQLDFESMSRRLLADAWSVLSTAEQGELLAGVETLVRERTLVRAQERFQFLETIRYDEPALHGNEATCKSLLLASKAGHRVELNVDWVLVQRDGRWRVVDMTNLGTLISAEIRETQILPALDEGGVPALMQALRRELAAVRRP